MVETFCECGAPIAAAESTTGQTSACAQCGKPVTLVSAEALADGAGIGDFDARLVCVAGPARVGEQLLIGGVPEITIGKLEDRSVVLKGGTRVSRAHARLTRLDFGPSRWEIHDNNSTNGVFVNGQRVLSQELKDSDLVGIGEFQFKFRSTFESDERAAQAALDKAAVLAGAAVCPSCRKVLAVGAKICTNCGIDIRTGRSLVISKGMDEDTLAVRADTWIRTLSWIIPFGLFPIASEAFETKKPTATWIIFGATVLVSIAYLFAILPQGIDSSPAVLNMMQWNGDTEGARDKVARIVKDALEEAKKREPPSQAPRNTRRPPRRDMEAELERLAGEIDELSAPPEGVGFRWYQLFTSAMLHEPALIMPFVYHLGGNMLFLLVFGLRVNELVGNLRMSILYPILAAASGLAHHISTMNEMPHPSLGASGAIMGLAGMYFVFFPAQRVHMAIWFRGGMLTRWQCFHKVFRMRGFWLLVLWIGFNDALPMFIGLTDSVAHWAHLGGFMTGMVAALLLLIIRQASAHGSDILSVVLGRRAWGASWSAVGAWHMIESLCQCGAAFNSPESSAGQPTLCPGCGKPFTVVCAEALAEGAGAGDFDAHLIITAGPSRACEQFLLGGVAEITLGKQADRNIVLNGGTRVSRGHAKLVRLDFGPSRWEIQDNNSTNGLFVNGQRMLRQELKNGDTIGIGEYQLKYVSTYVATVALPAAPVEAMPVQALSYGTGAVDTELPPLGDADQRWVKYLRDAASFMLWAIFISFLSFCMDRTRGFKIGIDLVNATLSWFAAWLLTMPEPGYSEGESAFSLRKALRVVASIRLVGDVISGVGMLAGSMTVFGVGRGIGVAAVPQLFLFLLYFRKLAQRIPNPAMAINALIVMFGLPASVAVILGGAIMFGAAGFTGASNASLGTMALVLFSGIGGSLLFGLWYIALLIWFRMSFS